MKSYDIYSVEFDEEVDMSIWIIPEYSKKSVGRAGDYLIKEIEEQNEEELKQALNILNNWRSAHAFPLNSIQNSLRHRVKKIDKEFIITQRLKRIQSIKNKLTRFPGMRLQKMQDIGGCRVILASNEIVNNLKDNIGEIQNFNIVRVSDYLESPKQSGYRGIHIIFEYCGNKDEFKGLKVELQIRSKIQHYWATAVEIFGTFTNQQLKASIGEEELLSFFQLVSVAMDDYENSRKTNNEIIQRIRDIDEKLKIREKLITYSDITNLAKIFENMKGKFLVKLDVGMKQVEVIHFGRRELRQASEKYIQLESDNKDNNSDIVLIEAKSMQEIRKGYPNYFADSTSFIACLSEIID